jgi:hypothetical protein
VLTAPNASNDKTSRPANRLSDDMANPQLDTNSIICINSMTFDRELSG